MKLFKKALTMVVLIAITLPAQTPTGSLKGVVTDSKTKELLIGANVKVQGSVLGASANMNGEFEIKKIPVGSYVVTFSYIGYQTVTKTDVIVRSDRITVLNAELPEKEIQSKEVVVTGGYFNNVEVKSLSTVGFNQEEIRRAPGAAGDISRMIAILPGVSQVADNTNDLMVRGGSPFENGFFVDNIQIPNINHFPVQGASGGAIGILNVGFIEEAKFNAGGFNSTFGNRLSSVTEIKFREGNREIFYSQLDFNLGGFGGSIEGPFANGKGSYLLSAKRSYLDLIVGAIGTGAAPRYGDIQGKVVFDIDQNNRLTLLNIFGNSVYKIDLKQSNENGSNLFGSTEANQNSVGINWRWLWKNGFSNTSVSYSFLKTDNKWNQSESIIRKEENNFEGAVRFRNTNFLKLSKSSDLEFGFDLESEITDYKIYFGSYTNRLGLTTDEIKINNKLNSLRSGIYFNYSWNISEKFNANWGVRGDYYNLSQQFNFSPRISLSYTLNDLVTVKASLGKYYQNLPMYLLTQNESNKNLDNPNATHLVLGIDYLLTENTKLTLEAYRKDYKNFPLDPNDPFAFLVDDGRTSNMFGGYGKLESTGKAFTQGIELLIQKKLAEDFYGIISASWFKSRYEDYSSNWRDRLYDNQFLFGIVGGYKPNKDWEFSIRWNIAGGIPYTPFDLEKSKQLNVGVINKNKVNSERYPTYHNLNLRVDKNFYFNSTTLVVYLNVMNVYNRKNIAAYLWNEVKNEPKEMYQWGLIPILGIEYKF
jgi:outer membrane receptor for ferrienterochelin and colicin